MSGDTDPVLDPWCAAHLGSGVSGVLFRTGYLSDVAGVVLDDGRRAVVKIRPAEPRLADCARVQRVLRAAGFPATELLVAPVPCADGRAASAEALIEHAGGRGTTEAWAGLLAEQVRLAPAVSADALAPSPAWVRWDHHEDGLWPTPDDREVDLNCRRIDWIDSAATAARTALRAGAGKLVAGHVDWLPQNVWWNLDGTAQAVHDWDSLAALTEPAVAGVAAAIFTPHASTDDTGAFLDGYQAAAGAWTRTQLQTAWAAGLWVRLFDAKKDLVAGRGNSLNEQEVHERLSLAAL